MRSEYKKKKRKRDKTNHRQRDCEPWISQCFLTPVCTLAILTVPNYRISSRIKKQSARLLYLPSKSMVVVGYEPTPSECLAFKTSALDHSATLSCYGIQMHISMQFQSKTLNTNKSGISPKSMGQAISRLSCFFIFSVFFCEIALKSILVLTSGIA